jgi:hypothetical protein
MLFHNGNPILEQKLGLFVPAIEGDLYLGYRPRGPLAGAAFAGLMDEVTIYNRALSKMEMDSIYQAGAAGKCPPDTP